MNLVKRNRSSRVRSIASHSPSSISTNAFTGVVANSRPTVVDVLHGMLCSLMSHIAACTSLGHPCSMLGPCAAAAICIVYSGIGFLTKKASGFPFNWLKRYCAYYGAQGGEVQLLFDIFELSESLVSIDRAISLVSIDRSFDCDTCLLCKRS